MPAPVITKLLNAPAKAIFLVGFMGAGKSSVGRALAEHLEWAFEDLDDRIEKRERRSIAEIFRIAGEAEFRKAEREALNEVLGEVMRGQARIVGLGGGAFVQSENAAGLAEAGALTVFLDAPVEELWQRCVQQTEQQGIKRPLRQSPEQFRSLFESRRPAYLKASMQIETSGKDVNTIAREIARELRLVRSKIRKGRLQ